MKKKKKSGAGCAFCNFMRALAFSGLGAALFGGAATWLGADQQTTIISAMMGSIGLVAWVTRKRHK